jgi:hypothetical protein
MNIAKLILLSCPAFLASLLLIASPVHAASSQPTSMVGSAQSNLQLLAPTLTHAANPILDQLNCSCATCTQTKLEILQGKLPIPRY